MESNEKEGNENRISVFSQIAMAFAVFHIAAGVHEYMHPGSKYAEGVSELWGCSLEDAIHVVQIFTWIGLSLFAITALNALINKRV